MLYFKLYFVQESAPSLDASTGNRAEMSRFIHFLVSDDSSAVGTIPTTATVLAVQRNTWLAFASIPITFVPAFSTQGFSRIYGRPPSHVLVSSL